MTTETPLLPVPGWELKERSYTLAWQSEKSIHEIHVTECADGWHYVWTRQPTLTIAEAGPFSSLEGAFFALWIEVFAMADRGHDLLVAEARRIARSE